MKRIVSPRFTLIVALEQCAVAVLVGELPLRLFRRLVEDQDVIATKTTLALRAAGNLDRGFARNDRQGIDADLFARLPVAFDEDLVELETGENVSLDVSIPATYGFAGLRWSPPTDGRRLAPFPPAMKRYELSGSRNRPA